MDSIKVRVDDIEISEQRGTTILEAARKHGITIPTLCHHPHLAPTGSCRVCVVEVDGAGRLVGSCHTPIEDGMVIRTLSPRVIAARKATIELLLAGHTGPCVNDWNASQCDLHHIASDLEVGPPRFKIRRPRYFTPEEANPYVRRDMSKCILCSRCIGACNDIAKKRVFSTAYRGFRSKVIVDFDGPLDKEVCRDCLLCIDYCPTGALSTPGRTKPAAKEARSAGTMPEPEIADRQRGNLLPLLKEAQETDRCVSREFMRDTSRSMHLSVSDIYGVSTFYSFLSTRPGGKNIIRVCRSLPCYVRNSRAILNCIEGVLGIKPGETTPDGLFSLELANCIGACDQAPAMLVNADVHGRLTPEKIERILNSYKTGGEGQCKRASS
jgi:NADH:ubiquinone oxidoreductase subunit E/NAD-dependent dihydropyrimidine dehydrogenase PreA subunit/ferredoxin